MNSKELSRILLKEYHLSQDLSNQILKTILKTIVSELKKAILSALEIRKVKWKNFIILLLVLLIFTPTVIFANTEEEKKAEALAVFVTSLTVADALHDYIYTRPSLFADEFGLYVDIRVDYEKLFIGIVKGLYNKYQEERVYLYAKLLRYFGRKTADNLIFLFEHFDVWKKIVGEG